MESETHLYHFGPFCLNAEECVLLRHGRVVPLPAKALRTLLVLVRNKGHIVEKDALMEQVWPDEFVEEGNLAQNIFVLRKALGESVEGPKYIETVPRRGYRFSQSVTGSDYDAVLSVAVPPESKGPLRTNSHVIAVLPFVNANDNPDLEWLIDGLTESIINTLSQRRELRVIARNSVFHYKGKNVDARQIGRELRVDSVLVGTLDRVAEALTISTELIDVTNGWQLFGRTYRRKFSEMLETQYEIATEISAAIQADFTGVEESRAFRHHQVNPEAFRVYLKGRYYWNKYTDEGLQRALECFREAIDIDPLYALAYAGLGDAYFRMSNECLSPRLTLPKAKAAVLRALEIDSELPQAHALLGMVLMRFDWDWQAAARQFNKAISLNPGDPLAHHRYAVYLHSRGCFKESLHHLNLAQEIDPLSLQVRVSMSTVLWGMRKYDEALNKLHETLAMDPRHYPAHVVMGMVHGQAGNFSKAFEEFEKARHLNEAPAVMGFLGYVYAVSGNVDKAHQVLEEMQRQRAERYVPGYTVALVYAGLGEHDLAFTWLDAACEDRDEFLPLILGVDPRLDGLRSDARYFQLMDRIGLTQARSAGTGIS
jgi:TolB-like protein/Tfp pilus assembly protein PilF